MKVNAKSGDMADMFGRIYKMTALFKKKAEPKKAAPKKAAKPAVKMVKVMRFNVKDGERYLTEIEAGDFWTDINGDVGLADLLITH